MPSYDRKWTTTGARQDKSAFNPKPDWETRAWSHATQNGERRQIVSGFSNELCRSAAVGPQNFSEVSELLRSEDPLLTPSPYSSDLCADK